MMNDIARKRIGPAEAAGLNGNAVISAKPKPFAGRAVFAEAIAPERNLRTEVEDDFASFSASSELSYVSKDSGRIERDFSDSFGVPMRVFEAPKEEFSQRQVDRLNVELKKAEKPKRAPRQPKAAPPSMSEQVVEDFAAQSLKVQIPISASERAETEMANIVGTCVTVRPYSKSKRKNLKELDRE
jgi:hypothetical protein